jgi:DNA-binding MurR/RpiR family transcriptional regulator
MEDLTFTERVKEAFESLSTGQKKVAEYILKNMEKTAFSTAEQIGRETDVSQTTVIRLSYALGFSSFTEMLASIQQQVIQQNTIHFIERYPDYIDEKNPFPHVIEKDIAILQQMYGHLNPSDLWKAVNWLVDADQVLVVGYRSSFAPAHWFSFSLSEIRDHIHLNSTVGETLDKILLLTHQSVTFVISYPRYTRDALKLAESAKKRGSRIIAVTDHILSPVGRIADLTFTTDTNIESGFYSTVPVFSLLNLILTGMNKKMKGEIQTRRVEREKLYSSLEIFVE